MITPQCNLMTCKVKCRFLDRHVNCIGFFCEGGPVYLAAMKSPTDV